MKEENFVNKSDWRRKTTQYLKFLHKMGFFWERLKESKRNLKFNFPNWVVKIMYCGYRGTREITKSKEMNRMRCFLWLGFLFDYWGNPFITPVKIHISNFDIVIDIGYKESRRWICNSELLVMKVICSERALESQRCQQMPLSDCCSHVPIRAGISPSSREIKSRTSCLKLIRKFFSGLLWNSVLEHTHLYDLHIFFCFSVYYIHLYAIGVSWICSAQQHKKVACGVTALKVDIFDGAAAAKSAPQCATLVAGWSSCLWQLFLHVPQVLAFPLFDCSTITFADSFYKF